VEDHAAGLVAKRGVRMGSAIVDDLDDGFGSIFGSVGLFRGEIIKCDEQSYVNCASIVK
jgi:hypothetical protein